MRIIPLDNRYSWGAIVSLALASLLLGAPPAHAAQLALTWSDMSSNEDGFHVERQTGTGGTYATIATPAAGTTGYVDGTATAGTTYCYRVHAYNTAGDSAYSNETHIYMAVLVECTLIMMIRQVVHLIMVKKKGGQQYFR